jgi:hypothetical protein
VSDEKPLHVKVAEALTSAIAEAWWFEPEAQEARLGTHPDGSSSWALPVAPPGFVHNEDDEWDEAWWMSGRKFYTIPRYDTDWSATGPLIERYGLNVNRAQAARDDGGPWCAWRWAQPGDEVPPRKQWGDTAPLAVCHLILHLKGRLDVDKP